MKNLFKIIISALLFTLTLSASAAGAPDRGHWLCNTCELAPPATAMTADDLSDAWAFIKSTVNTQTGTSWQQNELVTVCDGTSCLTMSFQALACACWMPVGPTYKDNGQGYKNAQVDKNPPASAANGDSGNPFYRFFYAVWTYITGSPKVANPTVTITQSNPTQDLATAGFGSDFGSGFSWDSNGSTFSYGADFAYGGANAEYASGSLTQSGGCGRDGCTVVLER